MKRRLIFVLCLSVLSMAGLATDASAPPAGHITGVGGRLFQGEGSQGSCSVVSRCPWHAC